MATLMLPWTHCLVRPTLKNRGSEEESEVSEADEEMLALEPVYED